MASAAHASYCIKGNSLSEYPDERLLRDYQQQQITYLVEHMKESPNEFDWHELAEVTLSRILLFNARRGSEAAELSLTSYSQTTNNVDPVLAATLS